MCCLFVKIPLTTGKNKRTMFRQLFEGGKVEKVRKSRVEINMTEGGLFGKIVAFTLPVMLSGILQLLFNAADMAVVGQFVSDQALAAVGSTNSLVNLVLNLFMGMSVGTGVVMSRCYGAKNKEYGEKVLHTSLPVAFISGIVVAIIGVSCCRQLLELMGSPDNVIDLSTEYLTIYFLGAPMNLVYNFGAAVMRSTGDSKRPLLYLTIAGVINIIVNIISVVVFKMGVAGVAYATIASQAVSAVMVLFALRRKDGFVQFSWKKLRINKRALGEIVRIGVPSGIQGALFSISNMLIQSTINSFGDIAMAGNSVYSSLSGFIYTAMNSVSNAVITAIGQNLGARKLDRVKRAFWMCLGLTTAVGIIIGGLELLFARPLISIYNSNPEVMEIALIGLITINSTYFICGAMEVVNFSLRGIGYSMTPMIIVLVGTCAFRIFWIYCIFPIDPTLQNIYLSYPVSWIVTLAVAFVIFLVLFRRLEKKMFQQTELQN